jgi:hypothetical protein
VNPPIKFEVTFDVGWSWRCTTCGDNRNGQSWDAFAESMRVHQRNASYRHEHDRTAT